MNKTSAQSTNQDKAIVTLHVDVASVLAISEVSEIFRVKFQLTMIWRDSRLTFLNLKRDNFLNVVAAREAETIWTPVVIFRNTQDMEGTKVRPVAYIELYMNKAWT